MPSGGGHKGCKRPDVVLRNKRTATHGMTKSPEFRAWAAAKVRCTRKSYNGYKYYGGRGIEFRFPTFEEFYAEVGPRPEGTSLDRINPNGHYEKGNVRWATFCEQTANRRKYFSIEQFSDDELVAELQRRNHVISIWHA